MLVLTRRSGESIAIGDDIRIRVLRTNGSRVRIGIEAPTDVRIVREQRDTVGPEGMKAVQPKTDSVPQPRQFASVDRHLTLE